MTNEKGQAAEQPSAPGQGSAPARLPAPLDHIWDAFARRELGRGRRDVANLIEVTLQFLLEHESKGLAPMVSTLELIHTWSESLTKELAVARRLAAAHPAALPKPYPLVAITMTRSPEGVASLVRQAAGEPATTSAQVKAFIQSLEKQLVLIHQAQAEHTAALQAKREAIAATFRHHAALMHDSANQIIAALPPPQGPSTSAAQAQAQADLAAAGSDGEAGGKRPRALRDFLPTRDRLQAINWAQFSPVGLVKACAEALMRGYRASPEEDFAGQDAVSQAPTPSSSPRAHLPQHPPQHLAPTKK